MSEQRELSLYVLTHRKAPYWLRVCPVESLPEGQPLMDVALKRGFFAVRVMQSCSETVENLQPQPAKQARIPTQAELDVRFAEFMAKELGVGPMLFLGALNKWRAKRS